MRLVQVGVRIADVERVAVVDIADQRHNVGHTGLIGDVQAHSHNGRLSVVEPNEDGTALVLRGILYLQTGVQHPVALREVLLCLAEVVQLLVNLL